jgi:hypothetical protein
MTTRAVKPLTTNLKTFTIMWIYSLSTSEGQLLGYYDSREEAEWERDQLIADGFVGGYKIEKHHESIYGEVID